MTPKKAKGRVPHVLSEKDAQRGRLVRQAIERSGLKQNEVVARVQALGVKLTANKLTLLIQGKRRLQLELAAALAQVLNTVASAFEPGGLGAAASRGVPLQPGLTMVPPPNPEDVHRVAVMLDDYLRRRGGAISEREQQILRGWFKAVPPAHVDDQVIEDLLRTLKEGLERGYALLAARRGDGGPSASQPPGDADSKRKTDS